MPHRADIGHLYDQCGASLYRYALMILADPASAADAVHDVSNSPLIEAIAGAPDDPELRIAIE